MIRAMLLAAVLAASAFAAEVVTAPLILRKGGTAEQPVVYDGKGVVIDLGIDVSARQWDRLGDLWTSREALAGSNPIGPGLGTGLFIDEVPINTAHDVAAEKARPAGDTRERYLPPDALKPGQMGCTAEGLIYFRWPSGKDPKLARLILPPKPGISAVSIECSYIIVRNVTAMHASNDGFNIHGKRVGIRLENIRALANADEGISAHDEVEMAVEGAEIAWNASLDGGVADVGKSRTTYTRCQMHDNVGGGFKFNGGVHRVTDTTIWNQKKEFRIFDGTGFSQEDIVRK